MNRTTTQKGDRMSNDPECPSCDAQCATCGGIGSLALDGRPDQTCPDFSAAVDTDAIDALTPAQCDTVLGILNRLED